MNTSSVNQDNKVWDVFIGAYIVENSDNKIVWSGPQAQALPLKTPIHVITACNPLGKVLTDNKNIRHNQSLQKHIEQLSLEYKHVTGRSPSGDWQEASFAISGLTRDEACELAQVFDQRAIFELNEDELLVIEVNSHQVKRRRPR